MRLSGIGVGSNFFNSAVINQKVNRTKNLDEEQQNVIMQSNNRDSVFISKQGKQSNMMQQLMDQKQFIQECKDAEMKRGLENGYVDQKKLDEYDEQLEMLDQKIGETFAQETVQDNENNTENQSEDKVLTEEEYDKNKLMDMMTLSSGVEQSEVVFDVKNKMDGEANVLKAEIKTDGDRASKSKLERVAEIETRSSDLMEQIGEEISDVNQTISDSKDIVYEDSEKDERENSVADIQESIEEKEDDSSESI